MYYTKQGQCIYCTGQLTMFFISNLKKVPSHLDSFLIQWYNVASNSKVLFDPCNDDDNRNIGTRVDMKNMKGRMIGTTTSDVKETEWSHYCAKDILVVY